MTGSAGSCWNGMREPRWSLSSMQLPVFSNDAALLCGRHTTTLEGVQQQKKRALVELQQQSAVV